MTIEEARKVAKIIGNADSYCRTCVGSLVGMANREFPEFTWVLDEGDADEWVVVEAKP